MPVSIDTITHDLSGKNTIKSVNIVQNVKIVKKI